MEEPGSLRAVAPGSRSKESKMYAVIRETSYPTDKPLRARPEFIRFQDAHAALPGYRGTIVTHLGGGRHITVTLWETADAMNAAREGIGPAVRKLIAPLMTAPTNLLGTGEVAYSDFPGVS
jgi:hypothetical protein